MFYPIRHNERDHFQYKIPISTTAPVSDWSLCQRKKDFGLRLRPLTQLTHIYKQIAKLFLYVDKYNTHRWLTSSSSISIERAHCENGHSRHADPFFTAGNKMSKHNWETQPLKRNFSSKILASSAPTILGLSSALISHTVGWPNNILITWFLYANRLILISL